MMRMIVSVLFVLIVSGNLSAEPRDSVAKKPRESTQMKFDFVNTSLIVIPVFLNDSGPYKFLLDTGAGITVLAKDVAAKLNLRRGAPDTMLSAAGTTSVDIRRVDDVRIGNIRIEGADVAVTDFDMMRSLRIDGILGADRLRSFTVLIEYSKQTVRIERT